MDVVAYSVFGGEEEAAALVAHAAGEAFGVVLVLPVADRLNRPRPDLRIEETELVVVDHCADSASVEQPDCFGELVAVLDRVNPDFVHVGACEADHLES